MPNVEHGPRPRRPTRRAPASPAPTRYRANCRRLSLMWGGLQEPRGLPAPSGQLVQARVISVRLPLSPAEAAAVMSASTRRRAQRIASNTSSACPAVPVLPLGGRAVEIKHAALAVALRPRHGEVAIGAMDALVWSCQLGRIQPHQHAQLLARILMHLVDLVADRERCRPLRHAWKRRVFDNHGSIERAPGCSSK